MAEDSLSVKQDDCQNQESPDKEKLSRNTFVCHFEWFDAIEDFDDKTGMEVIRAIVSEERGVTVKNLSKMASLAMKFIRPQIIRDREKYESICRRNAENGKKGGRPEKPRKTQINPNNPVGILETQKNPEKPKKADNDIQESKDSMSIYKKVSIETKKEKPLWKESYNEYKELFLKAKEELLTDKDFREKQEDYYPNIDYEKSVEKGMDYWLMESTWKKVSRERVQTIQPKERLKKNFDKNRVYKPYDGKEYTSNGYPTSIDDVRMEDINPNYEYYCYWMEGKSKGYTLYDRIKVGFPENNEQYQKMLSHTKGGAKGFSYVVLVFLRDGWKEYDDSRGFKWIYFNYIKANGMFKE